MLCLLHRWHGFDSRARHLWQAKFGHELHWWRDSLKLCWTCLSFTKNQTTWTLYPLNTKSGCNTLGIRTGSPSDLESFPSLLKPWTVNGPVPCHSRTWEHGCGLHDDDKFLACRISLEFPNSNFIRLWWSSGKMLCLLHRWRGFDSRARHLWQAKFGHELHWWRDSLKLCWTCLSFTKTRLHEPYNF